jgi:hypothetical protein
VNTGATARALGDDGRALAGDLLDVPGKKFRSLLDARLFRRRDDELADLVAVDEMDAGRRVRFIHPRSADTILPFLRCRHTAEARREDHADDETHH